VNGRLRGLLREPLVHMVLLGLAVFAFARFRAAAPADPHVIRVDEGVLSRLDVEFRAQAGRSPTPEEMSDAVDAWVDRELLYREGLALGLDVDDPMIRDRVIKKMEFIQQSLEPLPPPSEEQLAEFAAAHPQRYGAQTMRYDFVQLVRAKAEDPDGRLSAADLEALRAGADPKSLGPRVGTSRRYTLANLARTFGPEFAAALPRLEVGQWTRVELPDSYATVRLDAAVAEGTADLGSIHDRVLLDFRAEQRADLMERALVRLRAQYRVEGAP
jgi:hypothetical protein